MKFKIKSQSSVEYLILFGIIISIIILIFSFFTQNYSKSVDEINKKRIDNLQNQLISHIEKVYYTDEGSKRTVKVNFPDLINNLSITNTTNGKIFIIDFYSNNNNTQRYFGLNQNFINFSFSNECSYYDGYYNILNKTFTNGGIREVSFTKRNNFVEIHFFKNETS